MQATENHRQNPMPAPLPAQRHKIPRAIIKIINRVITWVEVLVLLALLLFGVYAIWDNMRIDNENTASEYEMYKPTAEDTRTYEDFRRVNPDVCGWLTIDGTGIDYPLVQGDDNDEYMNTTPDLQFALSGSLFLDAENSRDFSDFNTIIYGHHMEGPSMFGALDQYVQEDFFNSHLSGSLFYDGQWHTLSIFAFLEVDAYDLGIYSRYASAAQDAGAEAESKRAEYLSYIQQNASQYRDAGTGTNDRIVVLSTCMTDKTNGRYIVAAKIGGVTQAAESTDTSGSAALSEKSGLSPQTRNLVLAVLAGLVILALLLLYLLLRHERKKKKRRKQADRQEEKQVQTEAEKTTTTDLQTAGGKKKKKKKATLLDDVVNLLIRVAVIVAAIWVIFSFVFGIYVNAGVAMEPSVQDRDIVLYYRLDSEYTANEAVVYEADGEERLGRIVARGGDTVEITEEGFKVNGYLQQEYKDVGETLAVVGGTQYPVTLAEDEVFILGDNREESTDSRMFGPIRLEQIKGSVLTVLRRRDI